MLKKSPGKDGSSRAPVAGSGRRDLTRWFPLADPKNPGIRFMAGIWRHIRQVLLGGSLTTFLLQLIVSIYTHGAGSLTNVRQWVLVEIAIQQPIAIGCLAFAFGAFVLLCWRADIAVEWDNKLAPYRDRYTLLRVKELKPEVYLSPYLRSVKYFERPADAELVKRIRQLQRRTSGDKLGVCVTGIPMAGKTRMAWEAMSKTLGDHLFIRWPHGNQGSTDLLPIDLLKGQRVVLWLDNLHEYANPLDAPLVADLPIQFLQKGVEVTIIATRWNKDERKDSEALIMPLLEKLDLITPENISEGDAQNLYRQVTSIKPEAVPPDGFAQRWDGQTPGSLIVGIDRMRSRFIGLNDIGAKRVLWSMQIMYKAGLGTSMPGQRVRVACTALFGWPTYGDEQWRQSIGNLCDQGFLTETSRELDILRPTADSYLISDDCIVPSPEWDRNWASAWRQLPNVFDGEHDFDALVSLGIALLENHAESTESLRSAEYCFATLLDNYYVELTDVIIATVHANLGATLYLRAVLVGATQEALNIVIEAERQCNEGYRQLNRLAWSSDDLEPWKTMITQATTNLSSARELKGNLEYKVGA